MAQAPSSVDLGAALRFVTSQPGWASRLLLPGILSFIPLLGPVALLGWQRRVVANLREGGEGLPELDLGEDLAGGIPPTVAVLNVALFMAIGGVLIGAAPLLIRVGAFTGNRTVADLFSVVALLVGLAGLLTTLALGALTFAVLPELLRRGHAGDLTPLLRPRPSLDLMRQHRGALLTAGGGCLLVNAVGSLGGACCFVGLAFTLPWAVATTGHLVAQWSRLVEAAPPPPREEEPPPGAVAWVGRKA